MPNHKGKEKLNASNSTPLPHTYNYKTQDKELTAHKKSRPKAAFLHLIFVAPKATLAEAARYSTRPPKP